jgi:hypothetical protein
VDRVKELYVYL